MRPFFAEIRLEKLPRRVANQVIFVIVLVPGLDVGGLAFPAGAADGLGVDGHVFLKGGHELFHDLPPFLEAAEEHVGGEPAGVLVVAVGHGVAEAGVLLLDRGKLVNETCSVLVVLGEGLEVHHGKHGVATKEEEVDAQDGGVGVEARVPDGVEDLHAFAAVHVGEADFAEVFGFDAEGCC